MLTFITEQKDGEPDTITSHMHKNLTVKVEDVIVFELKAPKAGWSHQQLEQINLDNVEYGEAYLGDQWVGSTEV